MICLRDDIGIIGTECQFELKGTNVRHLKEVCRTSYIMQDGAIKLFGMSMLYLSKKGKNDPKGNSEINKAITTGPGGKAASTSLSKSGTTKRSSTSQAAANQNLGTPGVLRARLPAFVSGVGLCLPET